MKEYTTKHGFKFKAREDAKDDWAVFEAASELDKGDTTKVIDLLILILGKDGYEALQEFHRVDGRVKASIMLEEFYSIMDVLESEDAPEKN